MAISKDDERLKELTLEYDEKSKRMGKILEKVTQKENQILKFDKEIILYVL